MSAGGESDAEPTYDSLLAAVREGTYDVPSLAVRLGLSESHVRLLLATVAEDASSRGIEDDPAEHT